MISPSAFLLAPVSLQLAPRASPSSSGAEMQYVAPEDAMRTDTVAGAAPSYHFEIIPSQSKL